jgi:hypothetical protein
LHFGIEVIGVDVDVDPGGAGLDALHDHPVGRGRAVEDVVLRHRRSGGLGAQCGGPELHGAVSHLDRSVDHERGQQDAVRHALAPPSTVIAWPVR